MIRIIRDYSLLLAFSGASWGLGQATGGIGVIRQQLDGWGAKNRLPPSCQLPDVDGNASGKDPSGVERRRPKV